ncbi:hypothetical protein CUR21_00105 [Pseudorhodobacter sp. MZDSW-24AT]|nr:hypothetical protein CUR21_00105 [Pseudorhodobacter sp. MZDSW-24AT]
MWESLFWRGNSVAPRAVVAEVHFAAATAHLLFLCRPSVACLVTKASLPQRGKLQVMQGWNRRL